MVEFQCEIKLGRWNSFWNHSCIKDDDDDDDHDADEWMYITYAYL